MNKHQPLYLFGLLLLWCQPVSAADASAADTSPALRITGGPYLQAPSATGATLVWTTNRKCVSRVEYGPSADNMPHVATRARHGLIDADTTLHQIAIDGLQPGSTCHYRVVSTEIVEFRPYRVKFGPTVTEEGQFTTLDPRKERFSFLVVNDRHGKVPELRQALEASKWEDVDLVVGLGDMINDPMSEEQIFRTFIDPCTEFFAGRIPLIFVRGNHEARGLMARSLMDYFPNRNGRFYYSFDHGGVHFLVLDAGEDKADDSSEYSGLVAFEGYLKEETEWLRRELNSTAFREARFRVCLLHIPPASYRVADEKKFIRPAWIRETWNPMLNRAGLDLMISGHTHRYAEFAADEERAFPVVVGGTHTVIKVEVTPDRLRMTTLNNDGTVLSNPPEVPARP